MILEVPQGRFELDRHPPGDATLRAWDAADEYALAEIAGREVTGSVLVVNDAFGALSVALAAGDPDRRIDWCADSYVSMLALEANLARNGLEDRVGMSRQPHWLTDPYDLVIVKVPRHLSLLEEQLRCIARLVHETSTVIGAGMTKHIHTSTIELFERHFGPTTTSLARKKARLIQPTVDPAVTSQFTDTEALRFSTFKMDSGETVCNAPGVFSSGRLDGGTKLLIDTLLAQDLKVDPIARIVDLGCGNGAVGTVAAKRWPDAEILFVDESFLALVSASFTCHASVDDPFADRFRFLVGDGLRDFADGDTIEPGSVDVVLNNPPFHANNAETDATAWRMFADAHRALRSGGELWVVGNRHLAYHAKLQRRFGNCVVAASNSKFVVLRALRR